MKKFKFLKFSNTKKLRYTVNYLKKKLYLIFLPGFMSDIEGKKPQSILSFAKRNKLGFLSFEYSGHGKSSGKFLKGNISVWTNDVKKVIQRIIDKKNFILIGSSMGAWVALNQFRYFKSQIKGFIGIGSAPEFLQRLMWNKFPKKLSMKFSKGKALIKNGEYEYPITLQLIRDGRKNKVLNKKINSKLRVTMIHGQNDEVVPVNFSRKVLRLFPKAKKKIIVVKNGDHSLSNKIHLKRIIKELNVFIKNIV